MLKGLRTRFLRLSRYLFYADIYGDNNSSFPGFIHMAHILNGVNICLILNQHTPVDNVDKSAEDANIAYLKGLFRHVERVDFAVSFSIFGGIRAKTEDVDDVIS